MKETKKINWPWYFSQCTTSQLEVIAAYKEQILKRAASTTTNRSRAKTAARRLGELAGLNGCKIKWASNPAEGKELSEKAYRDLFPSITNPLRERILHVLRSSLWETLLEARHTTMQELLKIKLCGESLDLLRKLLSNIAWFTLNTELRLTLDKLLTGATIVSPYSTFNLVFFSFSIAELGIEYPQECKELFELVGELHDNCFAAWMLPGTIILCDRPSTTEIREGKLVDMKWPGITL